MNWVYVILLLFLHILIFEWHAITAAPTSSNHLFKRAGKNTNGFVVKNQKTGKLEPPKSSFMQSIKNAGNSLVSKAKIALARPTKADRAAVQQPKPQQPNKSPRFTMSESRKEGLRKDGWVVSK